MIFWILVAIAALITIAVTVFAFWDDGFAWAAGAFFLAAVISAAVLALAAGILSVATLGAAEATSRETTQELRALGNHSSVEGRFYFLGGGYIEGKRVLNFIVQEDGYSTLEQVDADDSRIFEDETEDPYVTSTYWTWSVWWAVPWPTGGSELHDFHIPADSILENYTIDNSAG